ncbi:MAG: hypothetical protein ACRDPC_29505 [Solirubrobacteraceae bacterium]
MTDDPERRAEEIVSVLGEAFGDLIEADPRAFRRWRGGARRPPAVRRCLPQRADRGSARRLT